MMQMCNNSKKKSKDVWQKQQTCSFTIHHSTKPGVVQFHISTPPAPFLYYVAHLFFIALAVSIGIVIITENVVSLFIESCFEPLFDFLTGSLFDSWEKRFFIAGIIVNCIFFSSIVMRFSRVLVSKEVVTMAKPWRRSWAISCINKFKYSQGMLSPITSRLSLELKNGRKYVVCRGLTINQGKWLEEKLRLIIGEIQDSDKGRGNGTGPNNEK